MVDLKDQLPARTVLEISWYKCHWHHINMSQSYRLSTSMTTRGGIDPLHFPHGFQYSGEDLAMFIPKLRTSSSALSCDETLADVTGVLL